MVKSRALLVLAYLTLLTLTETAVGQRKDINEAKESTWLTTAVSPPTIGGEPAQVNVKLFIEEIGDINEGDESFSIDGYLDLSWIDSRLASKSPAPASRTYLSEDAKAMLDQIWWPEIEFGNENKDLETDNEELRISSDGHIFFREKVRASLSTAFEMRRFPFDTQQLKVQLKSFANTATELKFTTQQGVIDFSKDLPLNGWTLLGVKEQVFNRQDHHDRAPFSELEATITVRRAPGFFVVKFLVPLVVVMLLISGVFWMPADQIKDRVSATLTGMLTSAAYGFTVTKYLPANVYNTYLDGVILLALAYTSLVMIENVRAFRLHLNGEAAKAEKLDRICRVAFPLCFGLGLAILALTYGIAG